jgi:NAD(P)-dependent dehydrogenase (short-subunit alcohol dehydrogenase family)
MFDLANKTALITGAGQGVGFGIAQVLAQQGATVLINDIFAERADAAVLQLQQQGASARAVVFDVTDYHGLCVALSRVQQEAGPIDILVNNAGNAGALAMPMKAFRDMEPEEWRPFIDVNLYGVLNCTRALIGAMCDRGWGRVITISSEAGRMGLGMQVSLYGAAKAGAAHFMRHLALEVGRHGVTANSLSLGLMNNVPPEFSDKIVQSIPVGRLGEPLDIGYATAYLASAEAAWVTGSTLVIAGGVSPTA